MRENAREASQHSLNVFWFRDQVRNKAPWDYKQFDRGFQDFGNYNYGYTGGALGLPLPILLSQAGAAQVAAGTSPSDWGDPGLFGLIGGTPPYGDDPADQEMIMEGFYDRKNQCF